MRWVRVCRTLRSPCRPTWVTVQRSPWSFAWAGRSRTHRSTPSQQTYARRLLRLPTLTLGTSRRSVLVLAGRFRGENVRMAGSARHAADAVGGVYQFANVSVDMDRFELRRAGVPRHVEPQVLEVLAYLIRHRDRLVTKHELMEQVWNLRPAVIDDPLVGRRLRLCGDRWCPTSK